MKREVNYSNWREDLREVVDVPPIEPKTPKTPRREVKETDNVNNKVVINPTMAEANEVFKEIGGTVLDIQETEKIKEEALEEGAFKNQYGKKGKLSQSSERKGLGRRSSIKPGAKPTGYESTREFRDAAMKFSRKPNTKFRTEEKDEALELVKKSLRAKGALIDTKNQPKRQHWSKEHARKDYDPKRYDKKND